MAFITLNNFLHTTVYILNNNLCALDAGFCCHCRIDNLVFLATNVTTIWRTYSLKKIGCADLSIDYFLHFFQNAHIIKLCIIFFSNFKSLAGFLASYITVALWHIFTQHLSYCIVHHIFKFDHFGLLTLSY